MNRSFWIMLAFLVASSARAHEIEKVQPAGEVRSAIIAVPRAIAREYKLSAKDFVTFRDPQWSALTMGQIGAGTADMVTSLNNLHSCPSCVEVGTARYFIGEHPDAHKYIIGGILEMGIEAVTVHYLRNHDPTRKWYWRALWTLPQSLSLYGHARAAIHNAALQ